MAEPRRFLLTPAEHHAEAERLLERADAQQIALRASKAGLRPPTGELLHAMRMSILAEAQVHATLALYRPEAP